MEGVRGEARGCRRAPRGGRAPPSALGAGGGGGDTRRRAPRNTAGPWWWCCCSGWPSSRTSGSRERPRECLYRAAMAATLDVGCWLRVAGVRDPLRPAPPRCLWCWWWPSSGDTPRTPRDGASPLAAVLSAVGWSA